MHTEGPREHIVNSSLSADDYGFDGSCLKHMVERKLIKNILRIIFAHLLRSISCARVSRCVRLQTLVESLW